MIVRSCFRHLRKVEGLATGIPRIKEALRQGGFPEPSFEELGGKFFRLIVRNREFAGYKWLSQRQRTGVGFHREDRTITLEHYAWLNSLSTSTATGDIREMIEKGLLERIGKTRGSRYVLKKR